MGGAGALEGAHCKWVDVLSFNKLWLVSATRGADSYYLEGEEGLQIFLATLISYNFLFR